MPTGRFVVTYASLRGISDDIVARRFDAAGTPFPEFLVNAYTTGVSSLRPWRWTAVADSWSHGRATERMAAGTASSRNDTMRRVGRRAVRFRVNAYTTGQQGNAAVAMDAGGNFVVVWGSEAPDEPYGVFARRFNAAGDAAVG